MILVMTDHHFLRVGHHSISHCESHVHIHIFFSPNSNFYQNQPKEKKTLDHLIAQSISPLGTHKSLSVSVIVQNHCFIMLSAC
jgi:hypothetical protein